MKHETLQNCNLARPLGRTCALLARAQLLTTFTSPRSAMIKTEDWGFRTALM